MTPADAQPPKAEAWHALSPEEVLARVGSSAEGLSQGEAAKRLASDGPNELQEGKRIRPLRILLSQFQSLLIWFLIAAGVASGFLGEVIDASAILGIVILNALVGFFQEFKAEKSIAALKKMTAPQARVLRDKQVESIPATRIVIGDVLALEAGDLIAADARLLDAASFKCIESALTGESEAVDKQTAASEKRELPLGDRDNMVFLGTSVAAGSGRAVVVAAAMDTELGRIAALIAAAGSKEGTPLQKKLDSLGRILVWATLGIVAMLFGLGLLRGTPPFEMFMTAVSLAVAAVPEGLPTVVTVALALGVVRMSRRRALVRRLPAVETLGSTTVICTDKTGTLTAGEMTVRALYVAGQDYEVTGEGYGPAGEVRSGGEKAAGPHEAPLRELAAVLLGCNGARLTEEGGVWKTVGDPTEGALLAAGKKAGGSVERRDAESPRVGGFPFDSDRKLSTVIRRMPGEGGNRAYVNGAPEVLLARCAQQYTSAGVVALTEADRQRILAQNAALAQKALRVLGSAYRDLGGAVPGDLTAGAAEKDLVFVGLAGMYDPPRPEGKAAVAKCRAAGIRVIMITGDHPHTAMAIARELGIAGDEDLALAGAELGGISDDELRRRAPEVAVYARVTAEHKLRIIRAWKANGAVVAMTGDGVNDAPAIQGADIGIAMGVSGTEVAKQAADMVITDDDFATIVAAVEEGRGIYDNIRKTLQYLLAGNVGELLLMTACVIGGLPMPLLPIQLLWINLITDGLPALCLAADPIDSDVMSRPPRRRLDRIMDRGFLLTMSLTGLLTAGVTFLVFLHALKAGSVESARTLAFSALVYAELFRAFGNRSEAKPLWRIPLLSNLNLAAVVAVSMGLQVWSHHNGVLGRFLGTTPVPFTEGAWLIAAGLVPLAVLEIVKTLRRSGRPGGAPPGEGFRTTTEHTKQNSKWLPAE